LANHDPGSCGAAPDWEAIKHDVILSHLPVPRLRGNFCSGNVTYPDSTPGNRAITASSKVLSAIEGPITVAPVASPVVLGVEGEHVTARHPDLAVTKTTPIGNGISPYGEWFVTERLMERSDPFPPVMPDPVVFVIGDERPMNFARRFRRSNAKTGRTGSGSTTSRWCSSRASPATSQPAPPRN
jgi:hypothetical protein